MQTTRGGTQLKVGGNAAGPVNHDPVQDSRQKCFISLPCLRQNDSFLFQKITGWHCICNVDRMFWKLIQTSSIKVVNICLSRKTLKTIPCSMRHIPNHGALRWFQLIAFPSFFLQRVNIL